MVSSMAATLEERTTVLDREIAKASREGWTVTTVTPGTQAILQRKKRVAWFWVTVLSILTIGIFLIIVLLRIVNRKMETLIITVDDNGKVHRKQN